MNLILTSYVGCEPEDVDSQIDAGVQAALAAAGERIGAPSPSASTDHVDHGRQVHTDILPLDGATIEWSGDHGLTELRVVVPWRTHRDSRERTALAASKFAKVLTDRLQAA